MSGQIEAARQEIADTRAQLGAAAAELKRTIAERVTRAEERVDPRTYAKQYPWPALAVALAAGLALAVTGADAKAKDAAVSGAQAAGEAIGDGAVAAKDAVVDRFHSSDDEAPAPEPLATGDRPVAWGYTGIRGKVAGEIDALLQQGLHEILAALGQA